MEHLLPEYFLKQPLCVHVVGCGGTGCQILSGLARLHHAMLEIEHPYGLSVTAWDDDVVESHNIGRQLFFPSDVGMRKVDVLIHRLNVGFGVSWTARAERFDGHVHGADLIIGCVDSKASRRVIRDYIRRSALCYWLDLGNTSKSGQALIGLGGRDAAQERHPLPLPSELLPELIDGEEDTETPTCSVRASIMRQGLFLNQMIATWGLDLCFQLLIKGRLTWQGTFINLERGMATSIRVDPQVWAQFGYRGSQSEIAA